MAAQGPGIWFWVGASEAPPQVKWYVVSTPLRFTITAVLVCLLLFT